MMASHFQRKKFLAVNEQQKVRKYIPCKESGLALVIVQGVNRCWHKYFQAVTLRKTVLPDISCTYYTYRQIWIGKWDFYIKNCWCRGSPLYGFQDSFAGIMHMYSRALIVTMEALKIWLGRSFSKMIFLYLANYFLSVSKLAYVSTDYWFCCLDFHEILKICVNNIILSGFLASPRSKNTLSSSWPKTILSLLQTKRFLALLWPKCFLSLSGQKYYCQSKNKIIVGPSWLPLLRLNMLIKAYHL